MLQRAASLTRTKANGRCAKGEVDEKWRSAASDAAAAGKSADVMLASLACFSARLQRSPRSPSASHRDYRALADCCQDCAAPRLEKRPRFRPGRFVRVLVTCR